VVLREFAFPQLDGGALEKFPETIPRRWRAGRRKSGGDRRTSAIVSGIKSECRGFRSGRSRKEARMKWVLAGLALAAVVALAVFLGVRKSGAATDLKVGDEAPDFALVGSDGKTYRLAEFRGKKAVVVAWFPKAFTGG
jgi:hypothetical protein